MQSHSDKEKAVKFNRKLTTFLVCVLIATLLWLVMALSRSIPTLLEIPVSFTGINNSKTISNKLPTHLKLRVSTSEAKLIIRKYFFRNDTIEISSENLTIERKRGLSYLLTKDIQTDIEDQLKPRIRVLGVFPDTILFYFDTKLEKKIPVNLKAQFLYEKQYQLANNHIELEPDSIVVTGPEKLVRNVSSIETNFIKLENIKENTRLNVSLNKANLVENEQYVNFDTSLVSISASAITANIPIEKYTESTIEIKLSTFGFPSGINPAISPDIIKITYQVSFANYGKIKPEMFVAQINYTDLRMERSGKASVSITKKPDFIKITRIDPEKVNFLLKK